MAPEPLSDAGSATPKPPATSPRPRRGRRGGRGRRGRGPRTVQTPAQQASLPLQDAAAPGAPLAEPFPEAPEAPASLPLEPEPSEIAGAEAGGADVELRGPSREQRPARPRQFERAAPPPPRRDFRPASPAAVTQAIEQVNHIVETLRATLSDMEEVLETVELAERQKTADEQEIEALHRSLRQVHRPREAGPSQSRR